MSSSGSTATALENLKKKKPRDGWSVQNKSASSRLVRLLRRGVPLTDTYYLDIHYDSDSDAVVGILTHPNNKGVSQAQVLVDSNGKPSGNRVQLVSVNTYNTPSKQGDKPSSRTTPTTTTPLSDDQNLEIMRYAGVIVAGLVLFKLVFSAVFAVYLLFFPVLYFYLLSSCPTPQSFDAKKELKRVLRGHHLPDDNPDKPKGFLSETLARINASVTTELATGLSGYEVTMVPLAGAATVACVRVPAARMDFYWVGAAHKWWYVYGRQLDDNDE